MKIYINMLEEYKAKLVKRQESNKEIVKIISKLIDKYQDLRFCQILEGLGLPCYDEENGEAIDRFAEESVDTLKIVKKMYEQYKF